MRGKQLVTIEEFLKLYDKQQLHESKYSIGSKFKNSVRTICTITKYNPKTKIYSYLSGNSTTEYTTSETNINKNWKLIPEPKAHQSVMESKVTITKQSSYKIGDKVKIREDLNRHGNATSTMCNQLAFFKESGEPWTEYELDKIRDYCGETASSAPMGPSTPNRKYAYYDENTDGRLKVYLWDNQTYPEKLEQISYESIFGTSTKEQTKTSVAKKTTKGAQTEPIKQPKQIKKEDGTFMSKLKNTALATVEQNKEVAIIAAKMEAGRVLNKQVIKQIRPHIPMLLRGYLDTPLAPVILANAAAMLGNHTENKRVQKVAELMLLAAADTTVQSFNLDKIIDDVLSNIKLPAGILDADEE